MKPLTPVTPFEIMPDCPSCGLYNVIDSLIDVVCILDADSVFIFVSKACTKLWGYAPSELIGKPCLTFILPEDREKTEKAAKLVPSGIEVADFHNRLLRKDGSIIEVSWTGR